MKKNCNVIKDLLPLYVDEVCSKESADLVKEHLNTCKSCQKELEKLKEEIVPSDKQEVKNFQKFIKKINIKIIKRVVICSIIICVIFIGITTFIDNYSYTPDYSDAWDIAVRGKKNKWNFQLNDMPLGRTYAEIVKINEDGKDVYLVFLAIKAYVNGEARAGTPDMNYGSINIDQDIMRVYYTKENLNVVKNANEEELKDIINNSVYIFNNEKKTTTMNCTLNDEKYDYTITYYNQNGQILESFGDNTIPTKTDIYIGDIIDVFEDLWWTYKNAHNVFDSIEKYITDNRGSCTKKDINTD